MLILLPPSETKRDGGEGPPLDLQALSFSAARDGGKDAASMGHAIDATRKKVVAATVSLTRDPGECARVLKLSARQMFEVDRNRAILTSPTMPAIDRYTGVLFDGLDAANLPTASREFLGAHVLIQSALLGPVGALDPIPAYRLSFDSRLPTLAAGALKNVWSPPAGKALAQAVGNQLVLDLRSEGYAALAPLPVRDNVYYVRVVTCGADGAVRALNHFNKKGKGEFLRALALDVAVTNHIESVGELMAWAASASITLELGTPSTSSASSTAAKPAELNLVVSGVL